jgi:hypothetical protein
LREKLVP